MSGEGIDLHHGSSSVATAEMLAISAGSAAVWHDTSFQTPELDGAPTSRRRTPRTSVIVVLADDRVLAPERLAERLPHGERHDLDVIVAYSGEPADLMALQRTVGAARFLLAPAGTSMEDLRELAIRQAPGEIVTILSGSLLMGTGPDSGELTQTS